MKKIFSILFLLVAFVGVQTSANAGITTTTTTTTTTTKNGSTTKTTTTKTTTSGTNWDSKANLQRVNRIGNVLLTKNGVQQTIKFTVSDTEDVNAYADINKEIHVYRGLLNYVDYDHELAGVIAHEMGHILNGHCAKQTILDSVISSVVTDLAKGASDAGATTVAIGQQLASSKLSRNDEMEADITAVDLMIRAGYNPLALISVLNKICGNYIDVLETHPSGEKRLMNIYDYIQYNYPKYAKTGAAGYNTESYKKASTMIEANLTLRKNNKSLQNKYIKTQKKLLKNKEKRMKKMSGIINGWDASFAALYLMSK